MRKAVVSTIIALAVIGGGAYAWRSSSGRVAELAPSIASTEGTSSSRVAVSKTDSQVVATPAAIASAAADPRIAKLRDEADLKAYFDDLETDAREHGVGDQMARAMAAGKHVEGAVGGERVALDLRDIGTRLHRVARDAEVRPTTQQLDALATKIASERDAVARNDLIGQYQALVATLPEGLRMQQTERLRQTTALR